MILHKDSLMENLALTFFIDHKKNCFLNSIDALYTNHGIMIFAE